MVDAVDPEVVQAAQKAIDAMYEYFRVSKGNCAVQWLEDNDGRVLIFTRGEYRDSIMNAINENKQPTDKFNVHYTDLPNHAEE